MICLDTYLCLDCFERPSSSISRLRASSSCVAVCGDGNGGIDGSATNGCAGAGGAGFDTPLSNDADLDGGPLELMLGRNLCDLP